MDVVKEVQGVADDVKRVQDDVRTRMSAAADARAAEESTRKTYDYKHKNSNPYGAWGSYMSDVLGKAENKTADNPFGLDVSGSTINQTMRRMATDGWDDDNIRETIATVYGTNSPTAIEWSYTGD